MDQSKREADWSNIVHLQHPQLKDTEGVLQTKNNML